MFPPRIGFRSDQKGQSHDAFRILGTENAGIRDRISTGAQRSADASQTPSLDEGESRFVKTQKRQGDRQGGYPPSTKQTRELVKEHRS